MGGTPAVLAAGRGLLLLLPVLLVQVSAAHHGGQASNSTQQLDVTGAIVINELLAMPNGTLAQLQAGTGAVSWTGIAAVTKWFELLSIGAATTDSSSASKSAVDLSGYTVTAGPRTGKGAAGLGDLYQIPADFRLPAGAFLVVMCPQQRDTFPAVPAGSNVLVARGFKFGKNGLYLYDSKGQLVAATGALPEQRKGVSFGIPSPASSVAGADPYAYLASLTPWAANSGAKPGIGPFVDKLTHAPPGVIDPGQSIQVTAKLRPNQAPIKGATLCYRVNYGPEKELAMQAADTQANTGPGGKVTFTATIPSTEFKAGDMVRWRVLTTDTAGGINQEPSGQGAKKYEPQYGGTVVKVPAEANSTIPIMYFFAQDPAAATTPTGAAASLCWNGTLYDNVLAQKRGQSTLFWKKPKMKFKMAGSYAIAPGFPKESEIKTNSYYMELGENSFMKEVVAYKLFRDEGAITPISYHIQVYLNGQFWGLHGILEKIDDKMLGRYNLPANGPMYKSLSGELSNLRWDLPIAEMASYYAVKPQFPEQWQLLANFTKGLAGGGPGTRTSYLFDNLNLPNNINEVAINNMMGNMDSCTKNFYMYYDPETSEWYKIPWDIETSFGQDNQLGGAPGPYYCVLACEQWNSPLYCNSEHPQDIGNEKTPWGTITVVGMNPYQGAATGINSAGRKMLQAGQSGRMMAEGTKPWVFPKPDWGNPDQNMYNTKSVIGAAGTYNHLTDALLDVNSTRTMYLRRLRSLTDKYFTDGKLKEVFTAMRTKIAPIAAQDDMVWHDGDGSRGYQQLLTEYIPIRTKQLLQIYGPGGLFPLLPGPQSNSSSMVFKFGESDLSNSNQKQQYMSILVIQPAGEAVDLSGWSLAKDNTATWSFPSGTVILPDKPVHLSPSVRDFRNRPQSPKAGDAVFVLQVPEELMPQAGSSGSYTLVDAAETQVNLQA